MAITFEREACLPATLPSQVGKERNFMTMMNKILGFALLLFLIAAADLIVFRATARGL